MGERSPGSSPDPIEAYLGEATRMLRRRLPAAWAEDALGEARQHLEDRSRELIAEGMPPDQAKSVAVSAFGPATGWAKSIIASAYEDAGARRARLLSLLGFVMALYGASLLMIVRDHSDANVPFGSSFLQMVEVGILLLAFGAFRGRRSQSRWIAALEVGAVALLFAYFGCLNASASSGRFFVRTGFDRFCTMSSCAIDHYREELKLLRLGVGVYRDPARPVPAPLLDHGLYVAPGPIEDAEGWWMPWPSPLKRYSPERIAALFRSGHPLTLQQRIAFDRNAPYRVVATRAEAALAWRAYGERWIEIDQLSKSNYCRLLASSQEAMTMPPTRFDAWAGAKAVFNFLIFAALSLALEVISASAGRWAFRWRKASRPVIG
jgi:hypothetical protein